MVDVVNRGTAPGDPSADTAYAAFGKVNTKFDALDAADSALAAGVAGKADAAATTAALAGKADAAATTAALGDRVVGPGSASSNAIVKYDGATGKLVKNSVVLVADTTGAVTKSGGGGVPVQGTNTNDSAAAGFIGEYLETPRAQGSAVALTNTVAADIASLALTAGDWEVSGSFVTQPAATTTITDLIGSISTTTGTLDLNPGKFVRHQCASFAPGNTSIALTLPVTRISLSGSATVYLVGRVSFGTSTCGGWGLIRARRVR